MVALVVAALIGLVNGWFVTRLKIPSFLVTLGMLLVVRGIGALHHRRLSAAHLERRRPLAGASSWSASFYIGAVPHLHVAVLVRRAPRSCSATC